MRVARRQLNSENSRDSVRIMHILRHEDVGSISIVLGSINMRTSKQPKISRPQAARADAEDRESAKTAGLEYVTDCARVFAARRKERHSSMLARPAKQFAIRRPSLASSRWSSRRPGVMSGSARIPTAICK